MSRSPCCLSAGTRAGAKRTTELGRKGKERKHPLHSKDATVRRKQNVYKGQRHHKNTKRRLPAMWLHEANACAARRTAVSLGNALLIRRAASRHARIATGTGGGVTGSRFVVQWYSHLAALLSSILRLINFLNSSTMQMPRKANTGSTIDFMGNHAVSKALCIGPQ